MTPSEARSILGLGPDEDPRLQEEKFTNQRKRIAMQVRKATHKKQAKRLRQKLSEYDRALAVLRDSSEKPAPEPPPEVIQQKITAPRPRKFAAMAWGLVLLSIITAGGWFHLRNEAEKQRKLDERVNFLARSGTDYLENRRWQDAARVFEEIETLQPGSEVAQSARRQIEQGKVEEQKQFIGYWTGQAIAELEAGQLDQAEAAARKVLQNFPQESEAADVLRRIAAAREEVSKAKAITAARSLLEEKKWDEAVAAAQKILNADPANAQAASMITDAKAALDREKADRERALDLFRKAAARDRGEFDAEALDWLREAAALAPTNPEIAALKEKMSSYTRTLHVPGDFATPAEALEVARESDRIVLAEHTWKGPLVINAAIELQGAGLERTIIECSPVLGSPLTIGPDARGARISGLTVRHESFLADGKERFAAALVRGGGASFSNCRFTNASGHGLAVVNQGEAVVSRCQLVDNGWNGAAAIGAGSRLEVRNSEALGNFEHGIESWDGASVRLIGNRCEGNSRNGIHADNAAAEAVIENNLLVANREFGLVLSSAGFGKISGNTARENLLGGLVIRQAASALAVSDNAATRNLGPGLVLEKGLSADAYLNNRCTENAEPQILKDADLSSGE